MKKLIIRSKFSFSLFIIVSCILYFVIAILYCFISSSCHRIKYDRKIVSIKEGHSVPKLSDNSISGDIISSSAILSEYRSLYEENNDLIGWLKIDDTNIDYPVMQKFEDDNFYLHNDFFKNPSKVGCLVLDSESLCDDKNDLFSTNFIVHGHNMKNGDMFGDLDKYTDKEYGMKHRYFYYDTLYEHRKYVLLSVFYSKVYEKNSDVFKYYNFFNAKKKDDFSYFYENIMALNLYDTNEIAVYGDEFLTLSTCSYRVDNGRLVVVAKRIY